MYRFLGQPREVLTGADSQGKPRSSTNRNAWKGIDQQGKSRRAVSNKEESQLLDE